MTAVPSELPYRPGVGMMVLNAQDEVFVARRIDMRSEAWQMPQGGIDGGEDPLAAARRELKEEIGTAHVEVLAESKHWLTYDLPGYLIPQIWNGRYRGQRQKWFAMRFLGKDSEINLKTEEPEFDAWRWVPMPQVPQLIVPFKRELYESLVAEFGAVILRDH